MLFQVYETFIEYRHWVNSICNKQFLIQPLFINLNEIQIYFVISLNTWIHYATDSWHCCKYLSLNFVHL